MTTRISFFPVGNGDMTLITLKSGAKILIDCSIRSSDEGDFDVLQELRGLLARDDDDRLYVDVLLLSHPDQDHCRGLRAHFHLAPLSDYNSDDDKIIVREIWSSPIVFRRASKTMPLCDDAKYFCAEARRRVNCFRESHYAASGDLIQILGKDEGGKTDDIAAIVVEAGGYIPKISGVYDHSVRARLLAPYGPSENDDDEQQKAKNQSSTIIRFEFEAAGQLDACKFLTGGDAEVLIWENVADRYRSIDLDYDILLAPHHCSWHALSHDSWSEMREGAQVSENAKWALSHSRHGAFIVSSSREVLDDDIDPPCIRAKQEYKGFGAFICTGDTPDERLVFEVTSSGPRREKVYSSARVVNGSSVIGTARVGHG